MSEQGQETGIGAGEGLTVWPSALGWSAWAVGCVSPVMQCLCYVLLLFL